MKTIIKLISSRFILLVSERLIKLKNYNEKNFM